MVEDTVVIKKCSKCGEGKPATSEYFEYNKGGKGFFRGRCRACHSEYNRAYNVANRERKLERQRTRHAAHPQVARERVRVWREAKREREREHNVAILAAREEIRVANRATQKERKAAYDAVYRVVNRERVVARNHHRRALRRSAEGTHTADDIAAQLKLQKGKCHWCGAKVDKTYEADHIIPLSRGGSDWPENIVIACRFCNRSKGNKLLSEWVAKR